MSESSVSLPSLLLLAGISFVLYRLFFGSSSSGGRGSSGASGGRRIDPAAIEQVASMFPQLDRRAIAWDLQRNGGNAQATVERMLTTGRLEQPPPSFQPPGLTPTSGATGGANNGRSGASGTTGGKTSGHPDLIARYNLGAKLERERNRDGTREADEEEEAAQAAAAAAKGKANAPGWSSSRDERVAMIQKRKEQMILQARRRMEDKDRREAKGKGPERVQ